MVSVIIPVFNEEENLQSCISSLLEQTYNDTEIIIIDDGSYDNSYKIIEHIKTNTKKNQIITLKQNHLGPGKARNLGAKKAQGNIVVFVDADMTFDKDFIKNLIAPIQKGQANGTFTKEEYVSNWDNSIARAWNYLQGRSGKERVAKVDRFEGSVFRAILKTEFDKVNGFDENIGYTDDWSLSRKLKYRATIANHALCYHKNPDTLKKVYSQARWIGKNEFITGSMVRRIYNLVKYNGIIQVPRCLYLSIVKHELSIIPVCVIYSIAVQISILKSFQDKNKYT